MGVQDTIGSSMLDGYRLTIPFSAHLHEVSQFIHFSFLLNANLVNKLRKRRANKSNSCLPNIWFMRRLIICAARL